MKRLVDDDSVESVDHTEDSDDSQSDIIEEEQDDDEEGDDLEALSFSHPAPQKSVSKKQPSLDRRSSELITIGERVIQWNCDANVGTDVLKEHRTVNNIYKNEDLFRFRQDMGRAPLDFFLLIIPLVFWKEVVTNTNHYAKAQHAVHWTPLVLSDLFIFLAILLVYSVRNTPRIRDLWREDSLFVCPMVRNCGMSYWRWAQIRKFLHIAPAIRPETSKNDNYWKVRRMILVVVENSKLMVPFTRHFSLDEMTVGYQGRTYLIKRTPSKKVPKGFQCLALSTDSGYVIDIHFDSDEFSTSYPDLSPTGNRVVKLASFLKSLGKHSILYLDNRFSTPLLFAHLLRDFSIYATGTWRVNFGVPDLIKIVATGVKEIREAKHAGVRLCFATIDEVKVFGMSLYDNAPFYMLTTAEYQFADKIAGSKGVARY